MKMKHVVLTVCFAVPGVFACAQSVTVGAAGTYPTISAALTAVQTDPAGPDIITILDIGPYNEAGQLLITGDPNDNDLTIQASAGVRPLVISDFNGDGVIAIIKNGNTTVKDLILIPAVGEIGTRPQAAVLIDDEVSDTGFNIFLNNILITSNDGTNQPVCSLDGLTSPTIDPGLAYTFRDEGVYSLSNTNTQLHKTLLKDVIVCGLFGDQGSDCFRTLLDGTPGSEFVVGEGCVGSYTLGISSVNAGFQPGGNEGGATTVRVRGTEAKPVKLINNYMNGMNMTNTTVAPSTKTLEWAIIANNSKYGLATGDFNEDIDFKNVTIANNGLECIYATSTFSGTYTASNCIFAGDGNDGATDVIKVITSSTGVMFVNDSAIVLNGPQKLDTANFDHDGLNDSTPSNVFKTNVLDQDPKFVSIASANAEFYTVANPAFGTAGPGGTPLRGGGKYNPAAGVSDWTMY